MRAGRAKVRPVYHLIPETPPKAHTMSYISRFCLATEKLVRVTVLFGAILFPALIIVCVYEVVARYLFNASQIWAFDITFMLHGALFMLSGAYGLQKKVHVRIDVFSDMLPKRVQHFIYAFIYLGCFLPAIWMLGEAATLRSWSAYRTDEVELVSAWGPLIWPFYTALALGTIALLLQTLVEIIRHVVGIFVVDGPAGHDPALGV